MHLIEQRHQERRFSRTSLADDEVDTATPEEYFVINAQDEIPFV